MLNAHTAPPKLGPPTRHGHAQRLHCAYIAGARSGRLAGFLWGALLGAAAVAMSLKLGWLAGAA